MSLKRRPSVFVNLPFDEKHEYLYLSLILSLVAFDFRPRSVLQIPANKDRLTRLVTLIRRCQYSLHDLSSVQLSGGRGLFRVPRFNMPFELGLAVAVAAIERKHDFRLMEEKQYRLLQSLSDCNGYDPVIHNGTVGGVFRAVSNAFAKLPQPLDTAEFETLYKFLLRYRKTELSADIYSARGFGELQVASRRLVRAAARAQA